VDIPICAAENVEGFEAKGILISPMYIYNKNGGDFMGCMGGWLSKICQLVGIDHLLANTSDNI